MVEEKEEIQEILEAMEEVINESKEDNLEALVKEVEIPKTIEEMLENFENKFETKYCLTARHVHNPLFSYLMEPCMI